MNTATSIYKSHLTTLKDIGLRTPNHSKCENHIEDYLPVYEQYFAPRRNDKIKFLECGIGKGGSMHIWRDYFPNGQIYGADFFRDKFYTEDRIQANLWCDQHQPNTLVEMIEKIGPCDIIVDDGSHEVNTQINTLKKLWEYVRPNGIYIIEDLHVNYWEQFGGGYNKYTCIEFLKSLIDNVNAIHTTRSGMWNEQEYNDLIKSENPYKNSPIQEPIPTFNKTVKFIHFYDSLCIIGKK